MEDFTRIQNLVTQQGEKMYQGKQIFEQQPQFIRMGLYFSERFSEMHNQQIMQRCFAADLLKLQGNIRFKNQDFAGACSFYEQALSIFRFIKISKEDWKQEGFVDSDLEYFDENGKTEKEKRTVKGLKVLLYQNICLVYLKISQKGEANLVDDAFYACSEAVKLDLKGSKAYYLRAKSRLQRANLGNEDYKLAIKDLKRALELDNCNNAIMEELIKCQELFQAVKFKEKDVIKNTKGGGGSGGTNGQGIAKDKQIDVPSEKEQQENNRKTQEFWRQFSIERSNSNLNCDLSFEVDQNTKVPQEIKDLEEFINVRSEEIMQLYEYTGRLIEADELKKQLDKARQAKIQLENVARLDFNKPNPKLVEIALKHDINLNDEDIKQQFKSIQEQNILDIRRWLMKSGFKSYSEQGVEQLRDNKIETAVEQHKEDFQNNIPQFRQKEGKYDNQITEQQKQISNSTMSKNNFNSKQTLNNLNQLETHRQEQQQNRLQQEQISEVQTDQKEQEEQQSIPDNTLAKQEDIFDDTTNETDLIDQCNEQFQEQDLQLLQNELEYLLKNCSEPQGQLVLQKLAERLKQFNCQSDSSISDNSDGEQEYYDDDLDEDDEEEDDNSHDESSQESKQPIQGQKYSNTKQQQQSQQFDNVLHPPESFFKSYLGIAITSVGLIVFLSLFYLFITEEE